MAKPILSRARIKGRKTPDIGDIARNLETVRVVILLGELALQRQNCEMDDDIALALRRAAAAPLEAAIAQLKAVTP